MEENSANAVRKKSPAFRIPVIVICALAAAVIITFLLNRFAFSMIKVSGTGMEPTVMNGERWLIDKSFDELGRGDIVTFSSGKGASVSRIVAVGGDSLYLDMQSGRLYINGELYDEPYAKNSPGVGGSYISGLAGGGYSKENPLVIEQGYVFVMGDNRGNSRDSREFGPISESDVFGVVAKKIK